MKHQQMELQTIPDFHITRSLLVESVQQQSLSLTGGACTSERSDRPLCIYAIMR